MECFFKPKLKMALAGETKIAADLADALVRVGQQRLAFLQLAAIDIVVQVEPHRFGKAGGKIRAVVSQCIRN